MNVVTIVPVVGSHEESLLYSLCDSFCIVGLPWYAVEGCGEALLSCSPVQWYIHRLYTLPISFPV